MQINESVNAEFLPQTPARVVLCCIPVPVTILRMAEKVRPDKLIVPNFKPDPEMEQLVKEYAQLCAQGSAWKSKWVTPEIQAAQKRREEIRLGRGDDLRRYLAPYFKKDYAKRPGSAEEEHRWIVATDFKLAEVAEKLGLDKEE